jgi:hypothetical protein
MDFCGFSRIGNVVMRCIGVPRVGGEKVVECEYWRGEIGGEFPFLMGGEDERAKRVVEVCPC